MNSTHVTAVGGGALAYAKLADLLTGVYGLSAAKADDLAWFVVTGIAALYALVTWWWSVRHPGDKPSSIIKPTTP